MVSRLCFLSVALLIVQSAIAVHGAEPVIVAEANAQPYPLQPQMAIDDQGAVHLVYGVGNEAYYTRSADGKSFTKPVKLPTVHVMALGMRRGPRIAVSKESICVTLIGGQQGKGRDGDVIAFRSADRGATWSAGVLVNDVPHSAREGLHGMTAGKAGEFACIWLDLRNKRTEVMASLSKDGGRTWSKNAVVYRSPSGSVCECCHPSIVSDASGRLVAMWRNSLDGERDMYYAICEPGQTSFGEARKLGQGSWMLDRCPMDGGAVTVAKDGSIQTVWRRNKELYTTAAGKPEMKLAAGEQPVIAANSTGTAAAWLTKRRGDLMLSANGAEPQKIAADASDPAIVASPNASRIALAWETRTGTTARIHFLAVE